MSININYEKCAELINSVLERVGILEIVRKDSSVYVGGSLPAFIVSQVIRNKNDDITCNDIDLYTTNYIKTLHNFSKYLGNKIKSIKRTGVNVSFILGDNDIPIQIVTSEFNHFYNDVLGNYDTTLVAVGFYPWTNQFITHDNFMVGLDTKTFICHYEKSNPKRIEKLNLRANRWFNSKLNIVKDTETGDFRPYYKKSYTVNSLQDIVSPPNYVQLYYNKYKCIKCNKEQDFLMCTDCVQAVQNKIIESHNIKNKKITILGGVNGFGKILKDIAISLDTNNQINVTSRSGHDKDNIYKFTLGKPVSNELMNKLLNSDIIILNAYSTLENDERIWTTTIDTF